MIKMTIKQRKFIEYYCGNATEAAVAAGYSQKTARSQGQRLLTKVDILNAIKDREKTDLMVKIANRQERQEFWTRIMKNPKISMRDRLKASELLGKSEADFIEKQEVKSAVAFIDEAKSDLRERLELLGIV